jgi:predicted nucleotidyltransferase
LFDFIIFDSQSLYAFAASMQFYSNMSKVLANKGYYYQDAPIKNTGQPLDALDYGMLALAYDSRDLLSYYQAGVEQITIEYYYHQGIAILQSTKEAIYHDNLKAEAIENDRKKAFESFLKQFDLLLKMVQKHEEYRSLREMQGWQQLHDYLKSPDLLDVFKRSFKFKLTQCVSQPRVLKNTCEFYWGLMHAWSQYALPNAKAALREFNKFLTEKLSKNPFYGIVMEQTNALLLQLERNEPSLVQASSIKVDIQQLIQETRERFIKLLDIGSDLNTLPVMVLQKRISEEAAVILNHLLSAIENTLGSAPCAFSILGLGSYSREEMSLCSDIDFAILISDKSHKEHPYFKHFLSMLVHLRRGLPPNVLTIESKDLQTLLSQDKSLMQTPTEMIAEHCPLYSSTELKAQKNRLSNALSYAVQRAWLIFNSQTEAQESKGLYENYQILLTNRLKSLGEASIPYYQMVGQVCLEEHFKEQNGSELVNLSLNPSKVVSINLKKNAFKTFNTVGIKCGYLFRDTREQYLENFRCLRPAIPLVITFCKRTERSLNLHPYSAFKAASCLAKPT